MTTAGFYVHSHGMQAPQGTNLSVAFSGYIDAAQINAWCNPVFDQLVGQKYVSISGGGTKWTAANAQQVLSDVEGGSYARYDGICLDIEEADPGLGNHYAQIISAIKGKGQGTLVTVSHSAPWGISDAAALMQQFFANPQIDILSPQLYTSGSEKENDYATSHGVTWDDWATAKAAIAPSIVTADLYASAEQYFSEHAGITLQGYLQWADR